MNFRIKSLLGLLAVVIVYSCTKEPAKTDQCKEEVYKALYLTNYYQFTAYRDTFSGDAHYKIGYVAGDSTISSYYFTEIEMSNICRRSIQYIGFQIYLNAVDSIIEKSGYIQETGMGSLRTDFQLEQLSSNPIYDYGVAYTFENNKGIEPGALNMHLDFKFPYQGSASADSAFFFSRLYQMRTTITTYSKE